MYIEGNELMDGNSNVIVEWFTGNIALKTAGATKFITESLKKSLTENLLSKFSLIFHIFIKKFRSKLDQENIMELFF